ncbi:MAG: hypothetical protein FXF47_05025 [Candidatus Mcinerneyibacterium aminivorans]|uniref:Peptidase C39-like domain-containing protein n=1 Tax=Candidatus Mcinerneyibacterium aminivorans TaxID=2703815 RepID=A0A5D0MIJ9_9BACT|nr:MAG: hypothetical protein FXF47_05025 [Candidatus Mcinerneyibacterium aminivorans]
MSKKITLLLLIVVFVSLIYSTDYDYLVGEKVFEDAKNNDSYAMAVLGLRYRKGIDIKLDFEKAYKWLDKAAKKDNPIAYYNLAAMYKYGHFVKLDREKSEKLYKKAFKGMKNLAVKNNSIAQLELGLMYYTGSGTEKDEKKAKKWIKKSLFKGYPEALKYFTGYFDYDSKDKAFNKVFEIFKKKADEGNPKYQYELGNLYYHGLGTSKDIDKANSWYLKAQKKNNIYEDAKKDGDFKISNLLPPKYVLSIREGSCGETCLWSITNKLNLNKTQLEINMAGTDKNRGLHADEIAKAVEKFDVSYNTLSRSVDSNSKKQLKKNYYKFLYEGVINAVKRGNPVIIGVKVLPTRFEQWALDHFVLVVGYNSKTDELIYNDFENQKRIKAQKLLNEDPGYSFINKYNWVFAIEFLLSK